MIYTFAVLILLAGLTSSTRGPNKPIIGIVAIPSEFSEYPADSYSYFYSSYPKFIESGGAQVVPIPYDLPRDNMTSLLGKINGVLFTGGGTPMAYPNGTLTPIGDSLNFVVNYVVDQNKNGNYYPLWGTCMGFQSIAGLLNQNFSILTTDCVGCDGVNKNNFFNDQYQNRLYSQLPADLREKMTYANISTFYHRSMFHADTFKNTYPLNTYLTPTTFSYDEAGTKYVSSYESPEMPIYGTQYHQEKNTFEWRNTFVPSHSPDAVRLQQYLSRFFVNETRKNNNTFPDLADQQSYLLENHQPVVLLDSQANSIYFFPAPNVGNKDNKAEDANDSLIIA